MDDRYNSASLAAIVENPQSNNPRQYQQNPNNMNCFPPPFANTGMPMMHNMHAHNMHSSPPAMPMMHNMPPHMIPPAPPMDGPFMTPEQFEQMHPPMPHMHPGSFPNPGGPMNFPPGGPQNMMGGPGMNMIRGQNMMIPFTSMMGKGNNATMNMINTGGSNMDPTNMPAFFQSKNNNNNHAASQSSGGQNFQSGKQYLDEMNNWNDNSGMNHQSSNSFHNKRKGSDRSSDNYNKNSKGASDSPSKQQYHYRNSPKNSNSVADLNYNRGGKSHSQSQSQTYHATKNSQNQIPRADHSHVATSQSYSQGQVFREQSHQKSKHVVNNKPKKKKSSNSHYNSVLSNSEEFYHASEEKEDNKPFTTNPRGSDSNSTKIDGSTTVQESSIDEQTNVASTPVDQPKKKNSDLNLMCSPNATTNSGSKSSPEDYGDHKPMLVERCGKYLQSWKCGDCGSLVVEIMIKRCIEEFNYSNDAETCYRLMNDFTEKELRCECYEGFAHLLCHDLASQVDRNFPTEESGKGCAKFIRDYGKDSLTRKFIAGFLVHVFQQFLPDAPTSIAKFVASRLVNDNHSHFFTPEMMFSMEDGLLEYIQCHIVHILLLESAVLGRLIIDRFGDNMTNANTNNTTLDQMSTKSKMRKEILTKRNMQFFNCFSLDVDSNHITMHLQESEDAFKNAPFQVILINTYSALKTLLKKFDDFPIKALGVDFEGVKLNRDGKLCLMQIALDRKCVHVIDIFVLGEGAFDVKTQKGTNLKSILEAEDITKVWFDPRNDCDALWWQFHIKPHQVFDIQLGDVLLRKNRGLSVKYVRGLTKVTKEYVKDLSEAEIDFTEHISEKGKQLFEPEKGGTHDVFKMRPLDSTLLSYSAHDSRHLLRLYNIMSDKLSDTDNNRIIEESQKRVNFCMNVNWRQPSLDASLLFHDIDEKNKRSRDMGRNDSHNTSGISEHKKASS